MYKTATISSKNQITLPKVFLNLLGLSSGDKLLIRKKDDILCLEPSPSSWTDSLAGSISIPDNKKGIAFEQVMKKTKKIVSKKLAEER